MRGYYCSDENCGTCQGESNPALKIMIDSVKFTEANKEQANGRLVRFDQLTHNHTFIFSHWNHSEGLSSQSFVCPCGAYQLAFDKSLTRITVV